MITFFINISSILVGMFSKLSLRYVLGETRSLSILLSVMLAKTSSVDISGLIGAVPLLTKLSFIVLSDFVNHASPSSGILKIASIFVPNSSSLLSKYRYDGILTIEVASSVSATLTRISGADVVND